MGADLTSTESVTLFRHVATLANNGQKHSKTCLAFVYRVSWNSTNEKDALH